LDVGASSSRFRKGNDEFQWYLMILRGAWKMMEMTLGKWLGKLLA
jgi:hypothetical protein